MGGIGWQYALKDYQKSRIYTFLDPSLDPKGAGYQKIQSQIAVGSGGLLGKGFKQGSQAQLGYLPARHTDFIFSVLAEETGFLGVSVVLGLYLLLLWRMLDTAQLARDRVGACLAAGDRGDLRIPGRVQYRHGGWARTRQGVAASPHELWPLFPSFFIPGRGSHPECADAPLRKLTHPISFPRRLPPLSPSVRAPPAPCADSHSSSPPSP